MNKVLVIVITLFALLTGVYFINPFGVPINDPRSRILGITTYRVASSSMAPTLIKGELILVSSSTYMSRTPLIGEVIVFRYPENRSVDFVFRVAALAGDRLSIKKGLVYVNDSPLDEPYLDAASITRDYSLEFGELIVPDGHLFVLGDNRDNARDGRYWGFVPDEDVIGKVTHIWLSDNSERVGRVH